MGRNLSFFNVRNKTILDRSAQGAVPILECDGKFYSETQAIMSFIEKNSQILV